MKHFAIKLYLTSVTFLKAADWTTQMYAFERGMHIYTPKCDCLDCFFYFVLFVLFHLVVYSVDSVLNRELKPISHLTVTPIVMKKIWTPNWSPMKFANSKYSLSLSHFPPKLDCFRLMLGFSLSDSNTLPAYVFHRLLRQWNKNETL